MMYEGTDKVWQPRFKQSETSNADMPGSGIFYNKDATDLWIFVSQNHF
ncbi:hypothetical protein CLV32_0845 [Pedobacter duraquae]|uniref:Uncharacterized protein n=1 Tax=Pedobacter duraquae TaxID=425511 RepID=A0A4R6IRG3_9SPHI|nr:hypothetical protein CLV32_0845 [Pedobacter duraquae]